MPQYRFAGPTAYDFPASRDARGIPLGTVEPGDVRDLDEPPGPWWVPADSGEGEARPAGALTASTPSGIPAPPAAPPASPATQTDPAGVTGSEE